MRSPGAQVFLWISSSPYCMFIVVYAAQNRRRVSNIIVMRLSLRHSGHVIFGENVTDYYIPKLNL